MSNYNNEEKKNHVIDYGTYIFVWLGLLALTSLTVTVAGIHLGNYTLIVGLLIALTKASLVIAIFMHIKVEDPIFKVFIGIVLLTLLAIFILTFIDYSFR